MQRFFPPGRGCDLEQPLDLRRAGEGDRIDLSCCHPVDQCGNAVVLGRGGVDVGQHRVGLRPGIAKKVGEFAIGIARVKLNPDDQTVGGRLLGAHIGFEAELAQRPLGLRAAGYLARRPQPVEQGGLQIEPLRKAVEAAQALAGEQNQIVERQAHQPVADRFRIRGVADRHQRAAHGLGAFGFEHLGEPIDLAGFGQGDPAPGEGAR